MFDWIRQLLRAPAGKPLLPAAVRFVRGRYDAAQTSDENRRHWAAADGYSANAANNPQVRRILRNRARHEVANNSYARGIILTLAHDTVGTGPKLQMLSSDPLANRRIELEFQRWSDAVRLPEKLRTMRMARATDGESFAILITNPRLDTPIQMDLRLVEAEQVTTPLREISPAAVDGIVFDVHGNPREYHILKRHPGEGGLADAYDRLSADSVLHYYRVDRPGQARGIPELTPALGLFAQLRRYTLAVLGSAEAAAIPGGVLYTDAPAGGEADSVEPMDTIELERGMLMTMPGGWKLGQIRAEQPTTTYAEFKHEVLNEIARSLNMPFNVASGNSSTYNYASGRLDYQTYFKAIKVEQSHLESVALDHILTAWLDEAVLIDGFLPDTLGPLVNADHQWFWDGHEHVDPLKEANAQSVRLGNHTTTLADEYARRGQDWEMQLRQRAKELALMTELGLALPQPANNDITPNPEIAHAEDSRAA